MPDHPWRGPYPTMLPGVVLAALIALAVAGPVARRLSTRRVVAWLLVASVGWIVAMTMAPSWLALEVGVTGPISCDLSRFGPATLADYLRLLDPTLNILMFVPLGAAIGLLSAPYRRRLAIAAAFLPLAIELTQAVVVPLGRACESGDVFDNLAGLAMGLVAGAALRVIAASR